MDLACAVILVSIVILFVMLMAIIGIFAKSDADLTLTFYDKFGGNPSFRDKVVWITGASSGIGEYLAYDFATRHAKLILSGVNVERLEKVKRNCLEMGGIKEADILTLPFSMENFSIHEECVQKVIDTFGHIDILVNNAGVSQRADFQDIDIEVDLQMFNVNVFGTVNLTRKVLKHMLARNKGHIVVTSSTAGKLGAPYSSSYTGSKHAIQGYFECLRSEMIGKNIDVTIVCPGPVYSGIRRRVLTSKVNEIYDEGQSKPGSKMETDRCSYLMIVAIAHKIHECWICPQPALLVYYFSQYTPAFFTGVLLKIFFNREKFEKMRAGK